LPADAAKVAIVVPTWNRRDDLVRLLASLGEQTRPAEQVVVVDNGSTDGSAEAASQYNSQVIRLPVNRGFAAAVNEGLRVVRTPWVGVVNNDVTLSPDYLQLMVEAASASDAAFAVGRIMSAKPGMRNTVDGTFDLLTRSGCAWRAGHHRRDSPTWRTRRMVHFAPMTAAVFRSSVFEEFGLLDEEFESYLEDLEFSARLARAGLVGVYVPEAMAWHGGSSTLGAGSPAMIRLISRNQMLLAARHLPTRCLWRVFAGQLLWGVLALRCGAGRAWLGGKWVGLRNWRRWRSRAPNSEALLRALKSCEADLRQLQEQTGWDPFWRWYFRLMP